MNCFDILVSILHVFIIILQYLSSNLYNPSFSLKHQPFFTTILSHDGPITLNIDHVNHDIIYHQDFESLPHCLLLLLVFLRVIFNLLIFKTKPNKYSSLFYSLHFWVLFLFFVFFISFFLHF